MTGVKKKGTTLIISNVFLRGYAKNDVETLNWLRFSIKLYDFSIVSGEETSGVRKRAVKKSKQVMTCSVIDSTCFSFAVFSTADTK